MRLLRIILTLLTMKKSTVITIAVIVVVLIILLGIARRRREAAVTPGASDTGTNAEETTGATGTEPSNETTPSPTEGAAYPSGDITEIQALETDINAEDTTAPTSELNLESELSE